MTKTIKFAAAPRKSSQPVAVSKKSVALSVLKSLGLGKTMPRKAMIKKVYGKTLPKKPDAALAMIFVGIKVDSKGRQEVRTVGRGGDAEVGLFRVAA